MEFEPLSVLECLVALGTDLGTVGCGGFGVRGRLVGGVGGGVDGPGEMVEGL